jgi:hypothetical protein
VRFGDGELCAQRADKLCAKPPSQPIAREDIIRGPAELGGHGFPFVEEHLGDPASLIVAQARDAVRATFLEFG